MRRMIRWLVVGAALPAVWACNDHRLEAPNGTPQQVVINRFQETLNQDLDIVFLVDDSLSMQPLINKLTRNFPAFISVLQSLPNGLPNVHIAVVSSSMGTGQSTDVPGCPTSVNKGGSFQFNVGPGTAEVGGIPCTATGLMPNQRFISNVGGVPNYDTTFQVSPLIPPGIATVFSCIASLGDGGCGFEHQLAAVARALSKDDVTSADGTPVPPNNVGFVRENALLAIIVITNEDDCSAPPDSHLFDTSSKYVSDQYGPEWSYRCNDFGILCNGQRVTTRTTPYSFGAGECVSAEDQGMLIPVHKLADEIKSLKSNPDLLFVAAIAGPPDPYSMTPIPTNNHDPAGVMPNIDHSCVTPNTNPLEYADPSIRLSEFVQVFGDHGLFLPICTDSFAPALMSIANALGQRLQPKCVVGQLLDPDGNPATDDASGVAVNPDCSVEEWSYADPSQPSAQVIPSCAAHPDAAKCWNLKIDQDVCPTDAAHPTSHVLDLQPPPDPVLSGLNAQVSCSVKP